jgi:hypothetical protein
MYPHPGIGAESMPVQLSHVKVSVYPILFNAPNCAEEGLDKNKGFVITKIQPFSILDHIDRVLRTHQPGTKELEGMRKKAESR